MLRYGILFSFAGTPDLTSFVCRSSVNERQIDNITTHAETGRQVRGGGGLGGWRGGGGAGVRTEVRRREGAKLHFCPLRVCTSVVR